MSDAALPGFKFHKSLASQGLGELDVLKNAKNEFALKKKLSKQHSGHFHLVQQKIRLLRCPGFQQLVGAASTSKENEQLYFEFSKKNLEDHLRICQEMDMFVSEEDLMHLLQMLTDCGVQMEVLQEYHPSLTIQNIFRLKDCFKLLCPYVFDSYIEEAIKVGPDQ